MDLRTETEMFIDSWWDARNIPKQRDLLQRETDPQTRDLFIAARKLSKKKKLAYEYSMCRERTLTVFVKKSETSQAKRVRQLQDLEQYCVFQPLSETDASITLSPGAMGNKTSISSKD